MKLLKKIIAGALAGVMALSIIATSPADSVQAATKTIGQTNHDYGYNWAIAPHTYLTKIDGGYMNVWGADGAIVAVYYDNSFNYLKCQRVNIPFELWGGFYSDGSNYYIMTGTSNRSENNDVEVFTLWKFDKNWNSLSKVGVKNCGTYVPFDAGSIDFVHYGSNLYVRTCNTMYDHGDGLHHQCNFTMQFNTASMTLVDYACFSKNYSLGGYSSHSFNQFLALDGNRVIGADHGDAYPRSISVTRTSFDASTGKFNAYSAKQYDVLKIVGATGQNYTGARLGGLEVSSSSYLVAGTSYNQASYNTNAARNVFVGVVNKSTGATSIKWLTNISGGSSSSYKNPYLVKVNDDRFCVIYADSTGTKVTYTFIDGAGNVLESGTMDGRLGDDQPIVANGKITWMYSAGALNVDTSSGKVSVPQTYFYSIFADPAAQKAEIGKFVDRLYTTCLNRNADAAGRSSWVEALFSGAGTGSQAAYGFVFSPEFQAMNLCNEHYVERLYVAFMGRQADPAGKASWVSALEGGATREQVFNGFALSPEFSNLCDQYGIILGSGCVVPAVGTVPTGGCKECQKLYPVDRAGATAFVERLYNVFLNRAADPSSSAWVDALCDHSGTASKVAYGFVFSPEFTGRGLSNSQYIDYLYLGMFDRPADAVGKQGWLDAMNAGYSREAVFKGFVGSDEFTALCKKYGMTK